MNTADRLRALSAAAKAWGHHSALRESSDETIAYWQQETEAQIAALAAAAPTKPADCAKGCPPQTVCDYCQGVGGEDAAPTAQGEPVAWREQDGNGRWHYSPNYSGDAPPLRPHAEPLYTQPPAAVSSCTERNAEVLRIQREEVRIAPHDSYMHGLYNGMLMICCNEDGLHYQPAAKPASTAAVSGVPAPADWVRGICAHISSKHVTDDTLRAIESEAWRKLATPTASPPPADGFEAAQEVFTEYFVRNYPGPDTVICDPKWHAPRIFRAAFHAFKGAAQAALDFPAESASPPPKGPEVDAAMIERFADSYYARGATYSPDRVRIALEAAITTKDAP